MIELEAMILAGGQGTRLQSVISDRQKAAAEVAGKPFVHHLLEKLQRSELKKVILCLGYQAESVQQSLTGFRQKLELDFSFEQCPLGTGGAVRLALNRTSARQIMILNGDSFLNADLKAFGQWKQQNDIRAAILLARVDNVARFGQVKITEAGKILAFSEKGSGRGSGLINAGIYLIDRELLTELPEKQFVSLEKDFFPELVRTGLLFGQVSSGDFIDIGTPESYLQAQHFFSPESSS